MEPVSLMIGLAIGLFLGFLIGCYVSQAPVINKPTPDDATYEAEIMAAIEKHKEEDRAQARNRHQCSHGVSYLQRCLKCESSMMRVAGGGG